MMCSSVLLGPFHGAIAVPSVTHCRCRHREAARCGEWAQQFSSASCQ